MASWEDQMEITDKCSKLNINAVEFVPKFAMPAPVPVPVEPVQPEEPESKPVDLPKEELKKSDSNNHMNYEEEISQKKLEEKKVEKNKIIEAREIIMPSKEFVNIVFIGHVDAGKSTIGGHLLCITGMVDEREMEKNKRKAAEMNRESWHFSWALDLNEDERAKGKTVEYGRAYFETEKKLFTIIDAPGHKSYVNHMISGSSQADVAVLVISARIGEFEAGFERGGQTREHAVLVKTSGVKHLIVLINKMDDASVNWSKERFDEIKDKLIPFLKKTGFNPKTDMTFIPCSGYLGYYLKEKPDKNICDWYDGQTFIEYLDELPPLERNVNGPLRITIQESMKDMGVYIMCKIESGFIAKGDSLVMMPIQKPVDITQILKNEEEVESGYAGDNLRVKLKNIDDDQIGEGFVLCRSNELCPVARIFDAKVQFTDAESLFTIGYSCIIHIHTAVKEVSIKKILYILDPKNIKVPKEKNARFARSGDRAIVKFEVNEGSICLETYKNFQQMGRFIIRRNTQTVGQGIVVRIPVEKTNNPTAI